MSNATGSTQLMAIVVSGISHLMRAHRLNHLMSNATGSTQLMAIIVSGISHLMSGVAVKSSGE